MKKDKQILLIISLTTILVVSNTSPIYAFYNCNDKYCHSIPVTTMHTGGGGGNHHVNIHIAKERKGIINTDNSITDVLSLIGSNHIPSWTKQLKSWWLHGQISDKDFITAIMYLIQNNHK